MNTTAALEALKSADPWDEKKQRCCELELWKQTVNHRLTELEKLKKEIRAEFDQTSPPERAIEFETPAGILILSAKPEQRQISTEGIVRFYKFLMRVKGVGLKGFLELCREHFPLGVLDQHFSPKEASTMVTAERTGSRTVKAVAKSPLSA